MVRSSKRHSEECSIPSGQLEVLASCPIADVPAWLGSRHSNYDRLQLAAEDRRACQHGSSSTPNGHVA